MTRSRHASCRGVNAFALLPNVITGPLAAIFLLLSAAAATATEWPSLDLLALAAAGKLPGTVVVTVDDPVYHTEKTYTGYPLAPVLALIPDLESLRNQGAVAIFEAADGYKAVMSLDNALFAGGVIALRDTDAPPGSNWQPFKQGKETLTPAPFYLVWPGRPHNDWTFVWPYQLIRITIEPFTSAFGPAAPPADAAAEVNPVLRLGFDIFRTYCLRCHSMNLVGGELAPELNVPRNITEYWSNAHLRAFIEDPAAYRARSKMPGFKDILSPINIESLLFYLYIMAENKVCGVDSPCE